MKQLLFFLCTLPIVSMAQPGILNTIAGSGLSGFSGDGGIATSAKIGQALGNVCVDGAGNIYFADADNNRIRKVSSTGIITTFAGGGLSTADGIPATDAHLGFYGNGVITTDASGNLYIVDNHRIRKVNLATNIITTVAGTLSAGFSGDGGPATSAMLNSPVGICFDAAGNMYIGDEDNYRIRKVNTSGIINTYAGTGTAGFSGDGGPATAAQFQSPDGLCMDASGNMYVADRYNYRIRKISASGIVTTYAGTGSSGFAGDGGPATLAKFFEPSEVCLDSYGNLYVADFHNGRVRKISPAGIITTFAGGGTLTGTGVPATSASLTDVWAIGIDSYDNIYIADRNHYRMCRVGFGIPTAMADSFAIVVGNTCTGLDFVCRSNNYSAGQHIKTFYGDGSTTDNSLTLAAVGSYGVASFNKTYAFSGAYSIKHVLYNGSTAVDSVSYSRSFSACQNFAVKFYFDADSDCSKDVTEPLFYSSIVAEVDSNGTPVDTVACTSGFNYLGYGTSGTVYGFRIISHPAGVHISCPSPGIVYDTMVTGVPKISYVGLSCNTSGPHDLIINAVTAVSGVRDQWGHIYVRNTSCYSPPATITYNFSPKYAYTHSVPPETSHSGNTVIYDIGPVSVYPFTPIDIIFGLQNPASGLVTPGDTTHSRFCVSPIIGDADTSNNTEIIIDTVRAGCDPNFIQVDHSCLNPIALPATLKYTIHFENTGNDTAHNIYVLDTLSNSVDPMSLRLEMSSHEMFVSRIRDAAGRNILKFDFPYINLLDSSHHGLCDGTFIYYVKTKPWLSVGTNIFNRAGIYFDVNDVVMTNEAATIIGCPETNIPLVLTAGGVQLFPNPAADELTIKTTAAYSGFTISNSIGQAVMQQSLQGAQTTVNVKVLPPGLYLVVLQGEGGRGVVKFVKR